MTRAINHIAAEIDTALRDLKMKVSPLPFWVTAARPYVSAMLSMRSVKDFYGLDSGDDIVKRFLVNAQSWRGDQARRIKAELNEALKAANVPH